MPFNPVEPDPIRIAFFITGLETGGAEHCLAELVARIDRRRFQPVVYCLKPLPPPGSPSVVDRITQAGMEIHSLGMRSKWRARSAVRMLADLLRQQQPRIVQTFLFHANILGRLAARQAGVPHIVSGIRVAEHRHRWYLWLDRWTAGPVERHVCVSQAVADFSQQRGKLPADRLTVIPNGIDLEHYRQVQPADLSEFGIPAGKPAVAYIGRLDEQKRVDWLLRLSPRWMQAFPDHHLLLVGDGPQRAALEQLTGELKLRARVHFTGWRPDIPQVLAASSLLVLPSAWEGMPNVVLEAMASGLPVVATNVEGVREVLGPLAGEQTTPVGDAGQFAGRMQELLANPNSARELGESNRRRVNLAFGLPTMIARYEELYLGLLTPRMNRPS
ncbi:MAG: glycosyltransferase [Pirellulales bacterium]